MDIKISKADKIILKGLAYNPRIQEKELARKCNLSKDSIRYRIKRLEKLKVITGYGAFIDYTTLGYKSYKVYLKLNASIEQKQELKDFLKEQKSVFTTFESHGNWDLGLVVFSKTRKEYYDFENLLFSRFGEIINSKKICLMLEGTLINGNLIHEDKKIEEYIVWKENIFEKLDKKDEEIMKEFHKNSRISLVDLSYKINLSIDAIKKRIKKLEENKVISFYTTKIDYEKLGYEKYKLFIYVKNYSNETEEEIINFLKLQKTTINFIRLIGPWKLEVEFLIREHREFEQILSDMQKEFSDNIQRLDFSIFRNEVWFPSEKLLV